ELLQRLGPPWRRPVGGVLEGVDDPEQQVSDRHLGLQRLWQQRDTERERSAGLLQQRPQPRRLIATIGKERRRLFRLHLHSLPLVVGNGALAVISRQDDRRCGGLDLGVLQPSDQAARRLAQRG